MTVNLFLMHPEIIKILKTRYLNREKSLELLKPGMCNYYMSEHVFHYNYLILIEMVKQENIQLNLSIINASIYPKKNDTIQVSSE